MKKVGTAFLSMFLLAVVAGVFPAKAHALLLRTAVDSNFVVVDDVNNVQWADLNRFTDLNYVEVLAEIDEMNLVMFAGASDWHLAGRGEMESLFAEMVTVGDARQFDPTRGSPSVNYWNLGRYDEIGSASESHLGARWYYNHHLPDDSSELFKDIAVLNYHDSYASEYFGAFVVSSATATAPVPEPATLILLSTGLIGLVGANRKTIKGR